MQTIPPIAQLGNPVLRQIATAIANGQDNESLELIANLQTTLANSQGIGLAAPQIGVSKRLIIVASRPNARYPYAPLMAPTVMINPEFTPLSDKQEKDWEGCLSIPGIRAQVPRYTDIAITYTDTSGQTNNQTLTGFIARVFQHEYDHLEGKVYLDRVVDSHDIVAESEFLKRIAQTTEAAPPT